MAALALVMNRSRHPAPHCGWPGHCVRNCDIYRGQVNGGKAEQKVPLSFLLTGNFSLHLIAVARLFDKFIILLRCTVAFLAEFPC
jgi:hypothetical protein